MDFGNVLGLAKLLKQHDSDRDSDSDVDEDESSSRRTAASKIGPGSVGTPKGQGDGKPAGASATQKVKDPKSIWEEEEIQNKPSVTTRSLENDPRLRPEFETYYRQSIATEDIYLQMGMKTPCTSSCENLVVEISLPGEDFKKVTLDIKPELLLLRSPKYVFRFPTPHPVDPNGGNAKWDSDKEKLIVTLKLAREFDALNF